MPIPKPEETKNAYLNRCMSEAKDEYPNQEQYRILRGHLGQRKTNGSR